MFNKFTEFFLYRYSKDDFNFYLKSRLLLAIALFCSLLFFVMIIATLILRDTTVPLALLTPLAGSSVFSILSLVFLRKGKFQIAKHMVLIVSFVGIWLILFTVPEESIIARLDTISFIVAVLVIVPVLAEKRDILIYNIANVLVFAVFVKVVMIDELGLSGFLIEEYVVDVFVSFFIVAILSYLTSYFNARAIESSKEQSEKNIENYQKTADILQSIQQTVKKLEDSSENLSTTSQSFSSNAQNQAASAEEITATIEEISAGVENISVNTEHQYDTIGSLIIKMDEFSKDIEKMQNDIKEMLQLTETISKDAETGDKNLKQMDESMMTISGSSDEMTNIIGIINDISDQINLLSLNAAIEAARAGDAGRGFAVVADEISKLADKTSESVKDIGSLINSNETEIGKGKGNVTETVKTIKRILEGVSSINDMMNTISSHINSQADSNNVINENTEEVRVISENIKAATDEQKLASAEIVKSIGAINELSQANAAGSELIAGSAQNISKIAEQLREEVDTFG